MCTNVSLSNVGAWEFDTFRHVFVLKLQVCDFIPTSIERGNYLRGVVDTNGYFIKIRLIGYVMLAKDILISVISFYVDILIMGLKGVNLSIIALLVTQVLFAFRFAFHLGLPRLPVIEWKFHCLLLMIVGGFQFQMRSFCSIYQFIKIGIQIYSWVILLMPSNGVLSLQRYITIFFMNSLVPMRFHL